MASSLVKNLLHFFELGISYIKSIKRQLFDDFLTDFWVVSKSFPNIMLGFLGKRRLGALKN